MAAPMIPMIRLSTRSAMSQGPSLAPCAICLRPRSRPNDGVFVTDARRAPLRPVVGGFRQFASCPRKLPARRRSRNGGGNVRKEGAVRKVLIVVGSFAVLAGAWVVINASRFRPSAGRGSRQPVRHERRKRGPSAGGGVPDGG